MPDAHSSKKERPIWSVEVSACSALALKQGSMTEGQGGGETAQWCDSGSGEKSKGETGKPPLSDLTPSDPPLPTRRHLPTSPPATDSSLTHPLIGVTLLHHDPGTSELICERMRLWEDIQL